MLNVICCVISLYVVYRFFGAVVYNRNTVLMEFLSKTKKDPSSISEEEILRVQSIIGKYLFFEVLCFAIIIIVFFI